MKKVLIVFSVIFLFIIGCGGGVGDVVDTSPTENPSINYPNNYEDYINYSDSNNENELSNTAEEGCDKYPCAWLERSSDLNHIDLYYKYYDKIIGFQENIAYDAIEGNLTLFTLDVVTPNYIELNKKITLSEVHGFFIPTRINYGVSYYYPYSSKGLVRQCYSNENCQILLDNLTEIYSLYINRENNSILLLAYNGTLFEYSLNDLNLIRKDYNKDYAGLGILYASDKYILLASTLAWDAYGVPASGTLKIYLLDAKTWNVINSFEIPQEEPYVKQAIYYNNNWYILTQKYLYKFDEYLDLIDELNITEGSGITLCGGYLFLATRNLIKIQPENLNVLDIYQIKMQDNEYTSPYEVSLKTFPSPITCVNGVLLMLPAYAPYIYAVSASSL